jgi:hypothetical protein
MNEPQVRERLRQAFGEATYPAYLSGRIQAELRNTPPSRLPRPFPGRGQSPWLFGIRRGASLVPALLALLLIAVLLVGVQVWRNGGLTPRAAPAGTAPTMTVKAYQAMVSADEQQFLSANNFTCASFDDATCLPNVALADAATLQWLDDLNRNQPPARFVALNAVMRHHLGLVLSDDTTFVAAFKAGIANGNAKAASAAIVVEMAVLERLAGDAAASSRGTAAAYSADVLFQSTALLGCSACPSLVIQNLGSCQVELASSCIADIATARLKLETWIEDLVKVSAPDSLVQKDASLQLDLMTTYAALDAMETAVSAGDQVGFQARVGADAASITGGH